MARRRDRFTNDIDGWRTPPLTGDRIIRAIRQTTRSYGKGREEREKYGSNSGV